MSIEKTRNAFTKHNRRVKRLWGDLFNGDDLPVKDALKWKDIRVLLLQIKELRRELKAEKRKNKNVKRI